MWPTVSNTLCTIRRLERTLTMFVTVGHVSVVPVRYITFILQLCTHLFSIYRNFMFFIGKDRKIQTSQLQLKRPELTYHTMSNERSHRRIKPRSHYVQHCTSTHARRRTATYGTVRRRTSTQYIAHANYILIKLNKIPKSAVCH